MVAPGDFLKVHYIGRERKLLDGSVVFDDEHPLDLMWDSRKYTIPAGGEGFAPFNAIALALGDPRSAEAMQSIKDEAGNVGFVLDRATEVRRLRTKYDNQTGNEGEILYAPQAEVYDLEDNRIRTVLDDPQGEAVIPIETTAVDRDALYAQIARQQRMIEMLAEQQGIDLTTLGAGGATEEDDEFGAERGDGTQTIPSDT